MVRIKLLMNKYDIIISTCFCDLFIVYILLKNNFSRTYKLSFFSIDRDVLMRSFKFKIPAYYYNR